MKVKHKELKEIIDDILWMAIRYAHGRHTTAPFVIRNTIEKLKELYPNFKLKKDVTIIQPSVEELKRCFSLRKDWLDDLFEEK